MDPEVSAKATVLRLWYINKNEGGKFTGANNKQVSKWDALLYKWMGKNKELTNHTATPEKNNYINNVKKYINLFNMYSVYKHGGILKHAHEPC